MASMNSSTFFSPYDPLFLTPSSWADKKENHLHAGDTFNRGKARWIKTQLNSFLMLWPNYAPSFSTLSSPSLVSHISSRNIQDWFWFKKNISADSLVLCRFCWLKLNIPEDSIFINNEKNLKGDMLQAKERWNFSCPDLPRWWVLPL